jgi:hypothetical protein
MLEHYAMIALLFVQSTCQISWLAAHYTQLTNKHKSEYKICLKNGQNYLAVSKYIRTAQPTYR